MKIAIYGIGERAEFFLEDLKRRGLENIEILYFVQSQRTAENFNNKKVIEANELKFMDIDYLVIASDIYFNEVITYLKKIKNEYEFYKDKVVKYNEFFPLLWERIRNVMPYQSCRIDGNIVYLAQSKDEVIPKCMFETGENYSECLINTFFALVEKYYKRDISKDRGFFLDIGANIGTTSIYVKKKINKELKIIGFEPSEINYDLFRINCILNKTEDITIELLGLSNSNVNRKFFYNMQNSGGSQIVDDKSEGKNISTIKLTKLDDYLLKNNILPESIDYIWMDTEEHECEILEGAMQTLSRKRIPLLQEFNPITYYYKGNLEKYCENIAKIYHYFIDINEYVTHRVNIYPITEIYNFALKMKELELKQTDLFFF